MTSKYFFNTILGKKKHKKKHFKYFKVVYTQVQVPTQTNSQTVTQTLVPAKSYQPLFDVKKFFNFGVYKRLGFGHGYGGVHVQQPPQETYVVEEKVVPQVVYEKRVVPKVVYEKRIVPEIVVEKKVVPQTVVVRKKVETSQTPVQTTVVKSEVPSISINKEVHNASV